MEEIFKEIPGYKNYKISNLGNVLATSRRIHVVMKLRRGNSGYYQVNLFSGKKARTFLIHRLVAMRFVDGYSEGLEVNHIDGNKLNNCFTNLEWVTKKQNKQHAIKTGLVNFVGENHPLSVLTDKNVIDIVNLRNSGMGLREISESLDIPFFAVKDVSSGRTWKHLFSDGLNMKKFKNIGDRHSNAKITSKDAVDIVLMNAGGVGIHALSDKFGLSSRSIMDILQGKTWKHATGI